MENDLYALPYPPEDLTPDEERSVTHGNFWIPSGERAVYRRALDALNEAGCSYVVTGAHAIYEHTGIYRRTDDLDLFVEPTELVHAMEVLKAVGFQARLIDPIWLSKAFDGEYYIDLIFGMGNGMALVDRDWTRYGREAVLAGTQVRVAPPEELIWHRLFISERHRQDMADILHLLLRYGRDLDWERLLRKVGPHWLLLLSHLQLFFYVYPSFHSHVPREVMDDLLGRLRQEMDRPPDEPRTHVTRGTLISRFSFAIDVREWGFRDLRQEAIALSRSLPVVREIAEDDVWDVRSPVVEAFLADVPAGTGRRGSA